MALYELKITFLKNVFLIVVDIQYWTKISCLQILLVSQALLCPFCLCFFNHIKIIIMSKIEESQIKKIR